MDIKAITERVAARGNQVTRKDKDTMKDTGGNSKGRDREPHQKPPRDDVKERHRERRKTKGEKDSDTQSDPDMKKGSDEVHPLDRKVPMFGGSDFMGSEYNYCRLVWGSLVNIVADEKQVSEKAFDGRDEIHSDIDGLLRESESMEIVNRFESQGDRPSFCAEYLYSRLEEV